MAAVIGCLAGLVLTILVCLIAALPFEWVWNFVVPSVFHLGEISYLQAAGLLFLLGVVGNCFSRSNS